MGRAISEVVVPAIGVAISPVPIVAVIVVLFSQRARVNGPVFLVSWAVGSGGREHRRLPPRRGW
jgi:hypothetical protein